MKNTRKVIKNTKTNTLSSHNHYSKYLQKVNDINFTRREIDIIACLLNGRRVGTIASFLSISTKTVETHIHNIKQKLECNSTQGIRAFIEKSAQFSIIKTHYLNLLIEANFKECLQKIIVLVKKETPISVIFYCQEQTDKKSFINKLDKHLTLVGLKTSLKRSKSFKSRTPLARDTVSQSFKYVLYIDTERLIAQFQAGESKARLELSELAQRALQYPNAVIFLLQGKETLTGIPNEINDIGYVDFSAQENYYYSVFEILKRLLPNLSLEDIILEFKNHYKIIYGSSNKIPSQIISAENEVTEIKPLRDKFVSFLAQLWVQISIGLLLCLGLTLFYTSENYSDNAALKSNKIQGSQIIHSDLPLPTDNLFLQRREIIAQIDEKIKGKQEIQTLAIVGIGGAGKTTLARQYAQCQKASVVWEINAETKASLINSFENLAYALCKTPEERKEMRGLQEIKNLHERENKLFMFIKEKLRSYPAWFLLYDNVESFSDIQNYFPNDPRVWGKGKILITTRDSNIQDNSHINHSVQIGELEPKHKLDLFIKILNKDSSIQFSNTQIEQAKKFLKEIPSFPLDVSIAAYYLKATNISYARYLTHLVEPSKEFEAIQADLSKDANDYSKTRYSIINLSLKQLMGIHQDFRNLLLFISLLDSQDIPEALLDNYVNDIIVEKFIYNLKKYSLITLNHLIEKEKLISTLSIHRTIQTHTKLSLLSLLSEDDKKNFFDKIITSIKAYYTLYSKQNHQAITLLIPHLEMLLKNMNSLSISQDIKTRCILNLYYILGYSYYIGYRNFKEAEKYLSLILNNDRLDQYFPRIMRAILLKDLGDISIKLNKFNQEYSQKSIQLCKKIPNSALLLAENLQIIGAAFRKKGEFEHARQNLIRALEEISTINDQQKQELEAKIHFQLGWLYSTTLMHRDKSSKAQIHLLKSLNSLNASELLHGNQVKPKTRLSCLVAEYRCRLGQVNNRLEKYDEALNHGFREAEYIREHCLDKCPHNVLIKGQIAEGLGEMLLRKGKIDKAEKKLSEAIQIFEQVVGKNSILEPLSLRAEARVRQGRLNEAYEDCLEVLRLNNRERNNFHNLLYVSVSYHAAIIKYKQRDLKKCIEYFKNFFKEAKIFCQYFLDNEAYQKLELQGVFTEVPQGQNVLEEIKKYFIRSTILFTSIYHSSHTFVKDYVVQNNF